MDNFDRHVWEVVGGAMMLAMTVVGDWRLGLAWLIGYGIAAFLLYGFATGRIVVRRKKRSGSA